MIRYTQGNLLDAQTDAVVNTVNEVGVMGKGIALMFREAFPENNTAYAEACKRHEVRVGRMFVTENNALTGPRWIINFPTKRHWRHPSKMAWIIDGLRDLTAVVAEKGIRSIAVPPLGCGNGGLEWTQVRQEIESALGEIRGLDVVVYEPTTAYQNAPKREGLQALTLARAMIVELVRRYWVLGFECTNLEVQKLAWFLQRHIESLGLNSPLGLRFEANKFGPYADQLRHLLDGLDGSYLHCGKRLADAGPLDAIWFEETRKSEVEAFLSTNEARPYLQGLEQTARTIDGFETPLGLELLSTVDWLLTHGNCAPDLRSLQTALAHWPGGRAAAKRKTRLFDERLIGLALARLHGTINSDDSATARAA